MVTIGINQHLSYKNGLVEVVGKIWIERNIHFLTYNFVMIGSKPLDTTRSL